MKYLLKNLGEISFEKIADQDELETAVSEIQNYLDLQSDTDLELTEQRSVLTVKINDLFSRERFAGTLLKFDGQIISAYFCRKSGENELELFLKSGSPFYEFYEPHKLHRQILTEKGFKVTESSEMVGNTTFLTLPETVGKKRTAILFFLDPQIKWIFLNKLKRFNLQKARRKVIRIGKRVFGKKRTMNIYRLEFEQYADASFPLSRITNRNSVADLLKYQPTEFWHWSVAEYRREVLKRIGNGSEVYTLVENEVLIYTLWHCRNTEISAWEVHRDFKLPEDSTCFFDAYTHPRAREKKIHQRAAAEALADIYRRKGFRYGFAAILADNFPSIRVAEKSGYKFWKAIPF